MTPVLVSAALWAFAATQAPSEVSPAQFGFANVIAEAKRLSVSGDGPAGGGDTPGSELDYDSYRRITFVRERQDLAGTERFRLQYAPRGFLFEEPIRVQLVTDGVVQPRDYSPNDFRFYDLPLTEEEKVGLGFSGLKLLSPINEAGKFDEAVSFQGASFFRALGAGNRYGASSRGLALRTASPDGEEFPAFTHFWIETPEAGAEAVRVYALLESESITGAYAFDIEPGLSSVIEVEARLFPRRDITRAGVAPLTSMFEFGLQDPLLSRRDYRPAVHDSEGLAITLANGERVWRPLVNPQGLEISSFAERTPRGFGLMQRRRGFEHYQDLEARYELRPSVWVEPQGEWGEGRLVLVEIPTANEFNDNIVAFWQPEQAWKKGEEIALSYRMEWGMRPAPLAEVAEVTATRVGRALSGTAPQFVLDFETGDPALFEGAEPEISASSGTIANVNLMRNPETGGVRLSFDLRDVNGGPSELRAVLKRQDERVSETWLYRWTAL